VIKKAPQFLAELRVRARAFGQGGAVSTLPVMSLADGSWYATTVGGTPGVVAILVTLFVAWYYWKKGKETKALGWTPKGITRIVTRPVSDVSRGLQLTWTGTEDDGPVNLKTPYLVKVRISNAGSKEIAADDGDRKSYHKPLSVKFKESSCYEAIITEASGEVIFADPNDSEVVRALPMSIISSPQSEFSIQMPALNISSWLELLMVADGKVEYPRIDCIISGQSWPIKPISGNRRAVKRSVMARFVGLGVFILSAGFALYAYQSLRFYNPNSWPVGIIAAGILTIFSAGGLIIGSWVLDRQDWEAMKRDSPDVFEPVGERRWFEPEFLRR
jgi:hypothetical protein